MVPAKVSSPAPVVDAATAARAQEQEFAQFRQRMELQMEAAHAQAEQAIKKHEKAAELATKRQKAAE